MIWAVFAVLLGAASASKTSALVGSAGVSCALELVFQPWYFDDASGFYGTLCNYTPALGSWVVCIDQNMQDYGYNSTEDSSLMDHIAKELNRLCLDSEPIPAKFLGPAMEDTLLNTSSVFMKIFDSPKRNSETGMNSSPEVLDVPRLASPLMVDAKDRKQKMSIMLIYFTNTDNCTQTSQYLFVYFGMICLVGVFLKVKFVRFKILGNSVCSRIRGYLTLPALIEKHAEECKTGGLFPTRFEALIVLGFLAIHSFALIANVKFDFSEQYEPLMGQYLRFIADRTGVLAMAELPLIFIFSGRNSLLEITTSLKYTTSIVLHKWIGRIMVVDTLCHGLMFGLRAASNGTFMSSLEQRYWRFGIFAGWSMLLIGVLSIGKIRRKFYEVFLVVHILLALLLIRFGWVHVFKFGWAPWFKCALCLWVLEKLVRAVRIWRFGGIVFAQATLLGSDIIRLTIPKPRGYCCLPGQYVFLYFMIPSIWHQSHPFTAIDLGTEILVVIKAKSGATKALHSYLQTRLLSRVRVCVEGPYGTSAPSSKFTQSLLITGGSGIPGPLSYALQKTHHSPTTTLIIVAREFELLEAFKPQILKASGMVNTKVFVTSMPDQLKASQWKIPINFMRPDVHEIIELHAMKGDLSITSCGPPKFVDIIRSIAARHVKLKPTSIIELFEEYQTW